MLRPDSAAPSPFRLCPLFVDFLLHLLMVELLGPCVAHRASWLLPFCPCPRVASQDHPSRDAKATWVYGMLKRSVMGQVSLCSYSGPDLCWVVLCELGDLGTSGSFQELLRLDYPPSHP